MKLHADIKGVERVREQFARIAAAPQRALDATAVAVEHYIEAEAGKHNGQGKLVASIYKRRLGPMAWEVGHDPRVAPYARFVHWGTPPHVIKGKPITPRRVYPKRPAKVFGGIFRPWYTKTQKTLRFAVGGRFVYANSVRHPGYEGDAWLTRAAAQAPRIFAARLQAAIRQAQGRTPT